MQTIRSYIQTKKGEISYDQDRQVKIKNQVFMEETCRRTTTSMMPIVNTGSFLQIMPSVYERGACSLFYYSPLSNIRPWSLIFFRVKPPCGHPYFSMVAYFFEVCVPIWSFIIIWSLIDFPGQKKFQGGINATIHAC